MKPIPQLRIHIAVLVLFATCSTLYAYDPPAGGLLLPSMATPQGLAVGNTVTALDSPWADRLNPASSAGQQRPVLEAGYVGLSDFGKGQGWGSSVSLGLSLPKAYGVWGAGLRFFSVPAAMSSIPLGTFVEGRGSIAKDLFPNLFVGAGLDISMGANATSQFGWGASLDLGMLHKLGDIGLLKEFRYGVAFRGLGIGHFYMDGLGDAFGRSFPSPFTLASGARALFVRTADIKAGLGLDLSFPTFQDLTVDLSSTISWRDIFSLRMGWGFSLVELLNNRNRSFIPSVGFTATIPLERNGASGKAGPASGAAAPGAGDATGDKSWNQAELRPFVSAVPLYGDIWAMGLGATLPLGVIDKKPPKIEANFPASSWGPYYLSPNSDGKNDVVEIPVKISDERFVVSWSFTVSDAKGKVIRHIANKETRPETEGFKGIWDRLVYIKKGVLVPEKMVWNGVSDSGGIAPDGEYFLAIEAVDDNGNRSPGGKTYPVVVKNSPPKAELSVPENPPIFSPDGDGNKDTLLIKMSGTQEDKWTAQVLDASNNPVRKLEFLNSSPSDFTWDGKDDSGKVVPDGVYSFVLSATDRALHSVTRRFDNIVVNTQQPPVNIVIDQATFSPNGDGSKDVENLFLSVPIRTGITGWRLSILDKDKREVWAASGNDGASFKERYAFDGRDNAMKLLPEGEYQASLAVTYLNGHKPKVFSPVFMLDVTPPTGKVSVDRAAFNPAGREGQNTVVFTQEGTAQESWTGEVIGTDGIPARTWRFLQKPDTNVEWDGADDSGKPVPDGVYTYRIKSTDRAGNSFVSAPVSVALDTGKKAARLAADQRAFSPNGDGLKDFVKITPQVEANDRLRSYELSIVALDIPGMTPGTAVRTWKEDRGLPELFIWDGLTDEKAKAPDGRYAARLKVTYQNDDVTDAATPAFLLRTLPPSIKVSAAPLLFSPTKESRRPVVRFTQKSQPGDDWEGKLVGPGDKVVRSYVWKNQAVDFVWDGTDDAGNLVADGSYHYEASSTDVAGNKGFGAVTGIQVDKRSVQVFVTASDFGLSPNGDGTKDDIAFSLIVNLREGIESWRFALVDKAGKEKSVYSGQDSGVPNRIVWDGRDASGTVTDGEYVGILSVTYAKGEVAEARTGKIVVDSAGPVAEVGIFPDLFSPDNDGVEDELEISLGVTDTVGIADWLFQINETAVVEGGIASAKPGQRLFISWRGTGAPTKKIVWDGRSAKGELVESATDYPFVFTARDLLGNSTKVEGFITVDVLVIKEGDRLKIKIPTIVFRPNFADFVGLGTDQVDKNMRVIKRIAQILNRFRDYRVGIEGHANSEGKIFGYSDARIDDEEKRELLPLSTGRAELVRKLLSENGVDGKRLSTQGFGSSRPVVDFKDAENRWKNRRVEFILIKNTAGGTGE